MRRLTVLLALAVTFVIAGQLVSETAPARAQILEPMIIRGRVTLDGAPTSANVIVSVFGPSNTALASTFTGLFGAPDEYELMVGLNTGLEAGELITVSAEPGLGLPFNFRLPVKTTLTSGATVTANIATFASVPPVVRVPDGGTSFASVPQFISIDPAAAATHSSGSPALVVGGSFDVPAVGGDLTLPVAVPAGLTLESLDDPVSGITVNPTANGSFLRIPFTDDTLDDTIRVLVETTPFVGDGTSATAQVTSLGLDFPTRSRDFSETSPDVGVGSVNVTGDISAFPARALLEMRMEAFPNEDVRNRIDLELARDETDIVDIAFSVEFITTNLDVALRAVTLRLDVGKAWLDGHADDSVEVFRVADDGPLERFAWTPVDPEADPVRFEFTSDRGLSTFVIAAVERPLRETPTPSPTAIATVMSTPTPAPAPAPSPSSAATATPVPPPPTATPAPQPTASSGSTADATPTAIPGDASAPGASAGTVATATPTPVSDDHENEGGGGSCNAGGSGGQASIGVIGVVMFPLGLLIVRRVSTVRRRRS